MNETGHNSTWSVYEVEGIFSWTLDMPTGLSDAEILAWQDAVLVAGDRHGILRVMSAPTWDFRFERDGAVRDWLRVHGDRMQVDDVLPAGFLLLNTSLRVASRIAYEGPDGIVEGWFNDAGDLAGAAGLAPPRHPDNDLLLVEVDPRSDDSWTATISTSTDIWFARNQYPDWPNREPVDNRVLSSRNAPRLNAFLADVRAAGEPYGASWTFTGQDTRGIRATDDEGYIKF